MSKNTSATQKANAQRYKTEQRAKKNKLAKIARHVKRQPNDLQAANASNGLETFTGRSAPSRNRALVVDGNTLTRSCGRLSSGGRLYQQLTKVAKKAVSESQYLPVVVRANLTAAKTAKTNRRTEIEASKVAKASAKRAKRVKAA